MAGSISILRESLVCESKRLGGSRSHRASIGDGINLEFANITHRRSVAAALLIATFYFLPVFASILAFVRQSSLLLGFVTLFRRTKLIDHIFID